MKRTLVTLRTLLHRLGYRRPQPPPATTPTKTDELDELEELGQDVLEHWRGHPLMAEKVSAILAGRRADH